MDTERWQRIEAIFHDALEVPAEDRDAFLRRACQGDSELLREVVSLLEGEDDPVDTQLYSAVRRGVEWIGERQPGTGMDDVASEPEPQPETIGPYRVLGEIGRGGLSTVFLAERADQQFTMRVAIKLVRRGMDTDDILRRLRLERQILANLDHPNIARLLDGGTTHDGRPYFVLEYIEGEPLTDWCNRRALPLTERLHLFRQVCEAAHYAHQSLVLHRDIKPSNILVTRDGVPKLLDFGIAKLLQPEAGATVPTLTQPGTRLLTPEYASPEQLRGDPLTTASDVYSLGVVLYLLVTGSLPHAIDRRNLRDLEEAHWERDPPRPSNVVLVGGKDVLDPRMLDWPKRRGDDLDTIILMALRKEPERRYRSAAQLSEDIGHYQVDLPVLARPTTLRYRTGKFVRRHRVAVSAGSAVLLSLVAGVIGTTWQAREAQEQARIAGEARERAEAERRQAEQVADFLVDLFEISDPFINPQREKLTAREMLDLGARRIRWSLPDSPRVRADLQTVMARAYKNLSLYPEAREILETVVLERRQQFGDSHEKIAAALRDLGSVHLELGNFERAETLFQEALAMQRLRLGEEHGEIAETLLRLGKLFHARNAFDAARDHYEQALALRRKLFPPDSLEVAEARNSLAEALFETGEVDRAGELFEQVLTDRRHHLGEVHPAVVESLNNLALYHKQGGDYATAKANFLEVLERQHQLLGTHHARTAVVLQNLASVHERLGELDAAETRVREAIAIYRQVYGSTPATAEALVLHGLIRSRQGDLAGAEAVYREALEMQRQAFDGDNLDVALSLLRLALVRHQLGSGEAPSLLEESVAMFRRLDSDRVVEPLLALGTLLLEKQEYRAAEGPLREAVERLRQTQPEGWLAGRSESMLAAALLRQGRHREAAPLLIHSVEVLTRTLGGSNSWTREAQELLTSLKEDGP